MEILLDIIHFIGIISFSAAGAMVAIDHETDWFGVVFLSVITCFGGGLLRDVVAGQSIGRELPVLFTEMKVELLVSILTATVMFLVAMIFKRKYVKEEKLVDSINNILDALGIGIFSAAGTASYLPAGPLVAIIMGMLSSVGGSLTRDIILNDIPFILRKRIYALATLVGSAIYYVTAVYIIPDSDATNVIATLACLIAIFSIRMCATYFHWNMPKAIDFEKMRREELEEQNMGQAASTETVTK
jgi:uncharacterized membrane protein YeiH